MDEKKVRMVAFVARAHGLSALKAVGTDERIKIVLVVTHKRLPLCEDSERSTRPDFSTFEQFCKTHDLPLKTVDGKKEAEELDCMLKELSFDAMISVSWRRMIPESHLMLPKLGPNARLNLHRGALPAYAGAEPIKQALLKKEKEIEISAHILDKEIDSGKVISVYSHLVKYEEEASLDENIERLKREITPAFGLLAIQAFEESGVLKK
eukprot:CAMPEP_0201491532 /NCGR_PEP_ID=MMETSP0151_2-20130828/30176_1 /ASSEMBLY_ACC=CAM_ASM_000257 /TAXON_ID=200890 /ORGANISM="Paramoeba atlantica, Strain 621/1 / CCAP 1560/9" /LENGTH=208 /DNA_ID=CAMNT_0047877927 /DNA_START=47 /DNA_END=673 /DNA_ORIENTATION=-